MGTRLRKVKCNMAVAKLSDSTATGGHGYLTNSVINIYNTMFYKLTIFLNVINNLEDMNKAIWAEYFHLCSTIET